MRTSTLTRALLPALLATAAPSLLGAQYMALRAPAAAPVNVDRAAELHETAMEREALVQELTLSRLRPLADLHYRSAMLRSRDDAQAVECLQHAANLLHRHDPARSARLMGMAADRAMERGDVVTAAHSYLDNATLIQTSLRNESLQGPEWAMRAREQANRAKLLSSSPLITDQQRLAIRERISEARSAQRWAGR